MWKWLERVLPTEHKWVARQLSAYLDSELSPPDQARVEAHLKECQTCAEELRTLRWTVNLTAQMPRLKAPRSFLITEAIAQPRRAPLSVAYVYLRGATVAVAALLLVVLASDFLLPYTLPATTPAPQMVRYKALPAVKKVAVEVEKEVIREMPVETVAVEKEVVKEVQVEKEVEKPAPLMSPTPLEAKAALELPVATPTPEEEVAKEMKAEAEQVTEEELEEEAMILMAPSAEQTPGRGLGLEVGRAEDEQEKRVEKGAVIVTPSPTSVRVAVTATRPAPHRTVEVEMKEVVPSPQPTLPPTATLVVKVTEPAGLPFHLWRSALHPMEMGLGVLMILLLGSTLIIRARHW